MSFTESHISLRLLRTSLGVEYAVPAKVPVIAKIVRAFLSLSLNALPPARLVVISVEDNGLKSSLFTIPPSNR